MSYGLSRYRRAVHILSKFIQYNRQYGIISIKIQSTFFNVPHVLNLFKFILATSRTCPNFICKFHVIYLSSKGSNNL